ncbi:hypothetical protein [Mucilaginibacter sp. SJ]|uniref:hypothetical protein n=1 Tax=Mucilaginibacter sp. SJ TaxID=3029053 RepID=UPI0023AA13C9|nr:hypothetical protein [Mucilaginibacter sp. SJ]WEA02080.1 hypothetical protein MusilaSJ_03970 [Mucilaginibacter sp. SJ]
MLKYWPFKKNYLLVLAAVVMAVASYELAIKHTLEARALNKQYKEQLMQQHSVTEQPGYTDRKNANLDRIIALYRADTLNYRSNAIGSIALLAERNNVRLVGAPVPDKSYRTEKYLLQKLTFSGDFFSLLRLLHQLPSANGIGMIRSCSFRVPSRGESSEGPKSILLDLVFEVVVK